jgi:hypothetical protein
MKNLTKLSIGLAAAFLVSCGDDKAAPDAPKPIDAAPDAAPDAFMPPAAPTLGMQIDRMARPAVNTALVAPLETNSTLKTQKKDAYNRAATPAMWVTTQLDPGVATNNVRAEFGANIGFLDVLDTGMANVTGAGCGNSALYNPAANPPSTAYFGLATVLSDDELYVDTTKGVCNFYLSLEVEVATGGGVPHTSCGGRTLTMDVVDISYSLLAAGTSGFDPTMAFKPKIIDGVDAHTDVSNDNFPFLGAPRP